jgi:hypothetical protein
MSETIETAREHLEHAAHGDGSARKIAVLVAVLAAALAVTEMHEKAAQNSYLSHHIQASDDWAFYQTKTIRMNMYTLFADTWAATPGIDAQKIADARARAARLDDDPTEPGGRKQLTEKARASEAAREHAFHRFHSLELAVGGLQIAIVLASVSVVTRVTSLAIGAAVLGAAAGAFAVLAEYSIL